MTLTDEQDTEYFEEEVELGKPLPQSLELDAEEDFSLTGSVKIAGSSFYPVPQEADFGSAEFMSDIPLADIAGNLVKTKTSLSHLKDDVIHIRWKKKGGMTGGHLVPGKTIKPSGLIREYTDADWILWIAADFCKGLTHHEVEATVFRQLCACGKDEDGNRVLRTPDFSEYLAVIREYGLVTPELRSAGQTMKQLGLGI